MNTRSRWRSVASAVCLVLGSVALLPAAVAMWLNTVVHDQDRYVATVGPLASDPAVQDAVSDRVTAEVLAAIDVPGLMSAAGDELAERGVGPRVTDAVEGMVAPLASGVEDWIGDQVAVVVHSDRFGRLWERANRAGHDVVAAALTDDRALTRDEVGRPDDRAVEGSAVEESMVSLDLGPVADAVRQRLADRGVEGLAGRLPDVDTRIVLVDPERLDTARTALTWLDRLGTWLPVASAALLVVGVLAAHDRRRALVRAGLGAAGSMVVLALGLVLARSMFVNALPEQADVAAATAVFDQVVGLLRETLRAILVAALIVAAAAFVVGPAPSARAVRRWVSGLGTELDRRGWRDNPVALWLGAYRRPAQIGVVVTAALVLVFWDYPSAAVVAWLAAGAALVVALVEVAAARGVPGTDGAPETTR